MSKRILCVDFDGVLHAYSSGWQGAEKIPDGPVQGALDWLKEVLGDERFEVCVYSSRSKNANAIIAMQRALYDWFQEAGESAEAAHDLVVKLKFPTEKPAAYLTIDDRAFCFEGIFPTVQEMLDFKPWNKKERDNGDS